jgi:hypothetical protein
VVAPYEFPSSRTNLGFALAGYLVASFAIDRLLGQRGAERWLAEFNANCQPEPAGIGFEGRK